jgi:hypothetical protein
VNTRASLAPYRTTTVHYFWPWVPGITVVRPATAFSMAEKLIRSYSRRTDGAWAFKMRSA